MNNSIFISYRRGRSQASAGRLFDRLAHHFGRQRVFMDVDIIEPGEDFLKIIDEHLTKCGALIVVIDPGWKDEIDQDGNRRLDNPHDFVRLEIEAALKRDIRIIPVLVDGGEMPRIQELPRSLQPLVRRNAMEIVHHRFGAEVDELADVLKRVLGPGKIDRKTPASKHSLALPSLLLSFEGRISRRQYWLYMSATFLAMLTLQTVFLIVSGESWKAIYDPVTRAALLFDSKLNIYLFLIPFLWPGLALGLKRLHDFGAGWGILAFQIVLLVGCSVADLAVATTQSDPKQHGLNVVYYYIIGGMWVISVLFIGTIKGMEGENRYGPDPALLMTDE